MSTFKYYKNGQWNEVGGNIAGDTLPIGAIVPYGSSTAPTNWLVCDGSAVSRITYSELFAIIGTGFGAGDGSTTFNLPNLKGRVAVGQDTNDSDFNSIGETGGSKTHTHLLPLGADSNSIYASINETTEPLVVGIGGGKYASFDGATGSSINAISSKEASSLQPYQVVCYIIKAKQSAGLVANVSNAYSTSQSDTYSCDYVNDISDYSTTETAIGKWINGKTIYRKVVDCGTMPNNTTKNVSSGITGTIFVTKLYGFMFIEGSSTVCLPDVNTSAIQYSVRLAYDIANNNVQLITGADRSGYSGYVVVEYTKATD